jgi:hypothetical protein
MSRTATFGIVGGPSGRGTRAIRVVAMIVRNPDRYVYVKTS